MNPWDFGWGAVTALGQIAIAALAIYFAMRPYRKKLKVEYRIERIAPNLFNVIIRISNLSTVEAQIIKAGVYHGDDKCRHLVDIITPILKGRYSTELVLNPGSFAWCMGFDEKRFHKDEITFFALDGTGREYIKKTHLKIEEFYLRAQNEG